MQPIYLTRHGVRATQIPPWADPEPFYEGEDAYDAPLAEMGKQQAEALATLLADKPIDHIFSSPFRRTIMTAIPIARIKGIPIKLEWGVGERLEAAWFREFPKLPSPEQRQQEFPEVDPAYSSLLIPQYPESKENMLERVAKTMEFLIHTYGPHILLIGHGASTAGVRSYLKAEATDAWSQLGAGFCCHYEFRYEGNTWKKEDIDPYAHLADAGLLAAKEGSADV